MSDFVARVTAHRAAWQAFQDAPSDDEHPDTRRASDLECQALHDLVNTIPQDQDDMQALRDHLEWWTIEEAQRIEHEPQPFALYAIIRLTEARERERV